MSIWKPVERVADLLARHETSSFDWKTEYNFDSPTKKFDVAQDVAAFASTMGGTILIGANEGNDGRLAYLKSVVAPERFVKKLSDAVKNNTRPLPVFEPKILEVSPEQQRQLLGCEPTGENVFLVAVNVWPLASGPVAVRVCDKEGRAIPDAWKFPLRAGEGTRWLLPEEVALYLSVHERKIAILLRRIPASGRPEVRVYDTHGTGHPRQLERIDDELQILVLQWLRPSDRQTLRAHVPFAFIKTVWQDEHEAWCIFVEGEVFHRREPEKPQFVPR